jgi:uncharacterized protein YbjT (DUF2867 family)
MPPPGYTACRQLPSLRRRQTGPSPHCSRSCARRFGALTTATAPSRATYTGFVASCTIQASVAAAVVGADAVVNAVSACVEQGGVTFEAVHKQGAKTLAQESAAAGVARFVLVSGIGADPESGSSYIRARGRGERAVRQGFPRVTVVRPGAMFGSGDALFGTLADLARLLHVAFGSGQAVTCRVSAASQRPPGRGHQGPHHGISLHARWRVLDRLLHCLVDLFEREQPGGFRV